LLGLTELMVSNSHVWVLCSSLYYFIFILILSDLSLTPFFLSACFWSACFMSGCLFLIIYVFFTPGHILTFTLIKTFEKKLWIWYKHSRHTRAPGMEISTIHDTNAHTWPLSLQRPLSQTVTFISLLTCEPSCDLSETDASNNFLS